MTKMIWEAFFLLHFFFIYVFLLCLSLSFLNFLFFIYLFILFFCLKIFMRRIVSWASSVFIRRRDNDNFIRAPFVYRIMGRTYNPLFYFFRFLVFLFLSFSYSVAISFVHCVYSASYEACTRYICLSIYIYTSICQYNICEFYVCF